MKELLENVLTCLSENRFGDAHTVVEGFLAADGLKAASAKDLRDLVRIISLLQTTTSSNEQQRKMGFMKN